MRPADEPIPDWADAAATMIVVRRGDPAPEILMVVRADAMRFVGGVAVFPGGRVEPQDHELARALSGEESEDTVARIAAIRETLEETGLLVAVDQRLSPDSVEDARIALKGGKPFAQVLEERGWKLDLDALHWMARWRPPTRRISHIFDTRFYVTDIGTGAVSLQVDGDENHRLFWGSARDLMARDDAGEITLIGPTRANLARLAEHDSYEAIVRQIDAHPPRRIMPHVETRDGEPWVGVPAGYGYPEMRFTHDAAGVVEAIEKETADAKAASTVNRDD